MYQSDWLVLASIGILNGAWFMAIGAAWATSKLYLQWLTFYCFYHEIVVNYILNHIYGHIVPFFNASIIYGGYPSFELQLLSSLVVFIIMVNHKHQLKTYDFIMLVVVPILISTLFVYARICTLKNALFSIAVGSIDAWLKGWLYINVVKHILVTHHHPSKYFTLDE